VLVASLAAAQAAPAQAPDQSAQSRAFGIEWERGWVSAGLSRTTNDHLMLGLTTAWGRESVVQAGLFYETELVFLGREDDFGTALTVQYGRSRVGRWGRLALLAGPAAVWGERGGDAFAAPGVLVNAQLVIFPVGIVGVGVSAVGNLNAVRPGLGVGFALAFEADR
jgi:hypothetical protein